MKLFSVRVTGVKELHSLKRSEAEAYSSTWNELNPKGPKAIISADVPSDAHSQSDRLFGVHLSGVHRGVA